MASISNITARQILDSRGIPTVEVTVELNNGVSATSSSPSGNIANELEAQELRDRNNNEYFGLGVQKAVNNVNTVIREALIGKDPLFQTQIDQALVNLDGTTNKSKLGANAILATSQAVMKTAAATLKLPLFVYIKEKYQLIQSYRVPTPIFNLLNGGSHGSGTLDFQEFQLVPASHLGYSKSLQIGVEMFMALDKILQQKGAIRTVGVEGGYSPNLATNTDALEIFSEAIKLTPYALAKDAFLGLDVAPASFHRSGKYTLKDRPQPMKAKELVQFYKDLHHQYRVFSFEDPLVADAWSDWKFMTAEMGQTAMIVADDLVSTNKTLLMKAIQEKACNAIVIKPNRVGTVTEAIEITHLARQNGWHTIMSHRSGETTDDFMADLAVGIGTEYVKFGAPSRGERVVKYNRLLRIEEILLRSRKSTPPNSREETLMNMSNDNGAR
ncbi:phosphopyruvate hydratase [Candidatus Woesebacteria bacterium]|nr:phosphopyruvate hydratase [Candidatus Woesebacteria bacterium]